MRLNGIAQKDRVTITKAVKQESTATLISYSFRRKDLPVIVDFEYQHSQSYFNRNLDCSMATEWLVD